MSSSVRIVVETSDGKAVQMDADEGAALADVFDEHAAPVPFGCRSASCGTCRIDVLEGVEELLPPEEDELDVLALFDADPAATRLACQARLHPGAKRVRVRPAQD
jgi:2Fe-2S ferredoxin